ncbi:acyltransferase [Arthrobacter sp. UC242_113]|uniref:acyltransferase n=1 Tax=Arthrobacter sp. UC242_113 TaxID=3374550 RepID=UPI0037575321
MKISDLTRLKDMVQDPGEHKSLFWVALVNVVASSHCVPARLRTLIYKLAGLDIATTCLVRPGVIFRDRNVSIGRGSTVNYQCIFDNRVGIEIGCNVGIGIGVVFLNTDHDTSNPSSRAGRSIWAPIRIGDGSFVGTGVVLLPGVSVGAGCVIAAGSVVTRDCEPHGLYVGTPAKRIKELPGSLPVETEATNAQ